jgi:aryl-alcohol dehydrogenase-like predicted oxidoreductase
MLAGVASSSSTDRYRQRFPAAADNHFRRLQDLWVSSIGLGTYLGDADDATDARSGEAIRTALELGCNLLDTAINYRCQRSERTIGATLSALSREGALAREEVVLCTKGGYLPFDGTVPADPSRYLADTIVRTGLASYEDIAAGCHCIAPGYLDHALSASLANLRVQTVDVYYLHNPEQQLDAVDRDTFMQRIEAAFGLLERRGAEGRLRYYGVATWSGLRSAPGTRNALSLEELAAAAERAGGPGHRFRVIQLPYNLAMPEAASFRNQSLRGELVTVLEAAEEMGLSVMISASLLQSRLASLPKGLEERIPGLSTSAQRAIQFVRSTPGVTAALVGMRRRDHTEENLALAAHPSLTPEDVARIFDRTAR